jgi:2-amino-4-hydroxy-6-hydroxymethyldihydropteridine diphosphokinase
MLRVILGLGSNLGDRAANIAEAIRRLGANPAINITRTSSLYETAPVDYLDQPDFLNAAVAAETDLRPEELLEVIHGIEGEMGRLRTIDKGPRNIDVDLLLYDIVEVRLPDLQVPHPRLRERSFALVPLLEVAPDAIFPTGEPVRWSLKELDISGVKVYESS